MNVEQLEKGTRKYEAIERCGSSLRKVRMFREHTRMACNYVTGLNGQDLQYLNDDELRTILSVVDKCLTDAHQRLIDEFDRI